MNKQSNEPSQTLILGGGCFWCTESVFQGLKGVLRVTPGYSGGHVAHPTYTQVCGQKTGHVEVVEIVFDPAVISLKQLLLVFFVTHDPTTLNRQGADVGPQYASAIFYADEAQAQVARRVMSAAEQQWGAPVVTQLREAQAFWPAEEGHVNYYRNNPSQAYCRLVIAPKLARLRKHFAELLAA